MSGRWASKASSAISHHSHYRLNHPSFPHPPSDPWKNCPPQNQFQVPKSLGATDLERRSRDEKRRRGQERRERNGGWRPQMSTWVNSMWTKRWFSGEKHGHVMCCLLYSSDGSQVSLSDAHIPSPLWGWSNTALTLPWAESYNSVWPSLSPQAHSH